MIVVGIHGRIGAGKDTLAAYLCRQWSFTRRAFADALKRELAERLGNTIRTYLLERDERTRAVWEAAQHVVAPEEFWELRIHEALWEEKPSVLRALLQDYGTSVRRADDRTYWIRAWADALTRELAGDACQSACPRIVVPDVRFRNEAEALRRLGARLVKIGRPGIDAAAHESEADLGDWTDWDLVLENNGTVAKLEAEAGAWIAGVLDAHQAAVLAAVGLERDTDPQVTWAGNPS